MFDIEVEIVENKYRRTYIGGSKKKEDEIFLKVQGTKEDNSDCDWIEYRRLLKTYKDDVLLVMGSWKQTLHYESYIMLFMALLWMKYSTLVYVSIGLGVLFQIAYLIIKNKENKKLRQFDMCITILHEEIKKVTGLNLDKF
jgi:hypothetical protein